MTVELEEGAFVIMGHVIIVVRPTPASLIASRSLVIPDLLRLQPIHIQSTPGRA